MATDATGTICACSAGTAPDHLVAAAKRNGGRGGDALVKLPASAVLIPGLVDCHIHMPQYAFTGTGMDLPLLQVWSPWRVSRTEIYIYIYVCVCVKKEKQVCKCSECLVVLLVI